MGKRQNLTLCLLVGLLMSSAAFAQVDPTGSWNRLPDGIRDGFGGGGYCTDGTYFYYTHSYRSLVRFEPATNAYSSLTDMPTQVANNSCQFHNGVIYSFGSIQYPPLPGGPAAPVNPIYRYTLATNVWSVVSTATAERNGYNHASVKIGDKMYLFGGYRVGGGAYSPLTSEFDPATETITPKADMPGPRAYLAGAAVGTKAYALCGIYYDGTTSYRYATNFEYDSVADTWATKAEMNDAGVAQARMMARAGSINGRVYVTGGITTEGGVTTYTGRTFEYRPDTDTWTRRADMSRNRQAHSMLSYNGKIYSYGGGSGVAGDGTNFMMEEFTPPDFGLPPVAGTVGQRVLLSEITQGGNVNFTVTFHAHATDPDANQLVRFDVQVKPVGVADWADAVAVTTGLVTQGDLEIVHTLPGFGGYDWRWKIEDAIGNASAADWTEFNNNAVSPDFVSSAPVIPPPPTPPGDSGGGGGGGCSSGARSGGLIPAVLALLGLLVGFRLGRAVRVADVRVTLE